MGTIISFALFCGPRVATLTEGLYMHEKTKKSLLGVRLHIALKSKYYSDITEPVEKFNLSGASARQ